MKLSHWIAAFGFTLATAACGGGTEPATETNTETNSSTESNQGTQNQGSNSSEEPIEVEYTSCEDLMLALVAETESYKDLVATLPDGKHGIRIENVPQGDSPMYDFAVFEDSQTHVVTLGRYTANAETGEIFEYDLIMDEMKPLEADPRLLKMVSEVCP